MTSSATSPTRLLWFRGSSDRILTESHRWNPHADVAELVDALVSGTKVT